MIAWAGAIEKTKTIRMNKHYVIGIDYGTDSVRSIIVDTATGEELASSVFYYPRWKAGLYCDPARQQFRQHPLDYIEGLATTVRACLDQVDPEVKSAVRAVSIDTTGSTPVAVDASGTPLALLPGFENNPSAMFVLWKDHTAVAEAEAINTHNANSETDYLKYVGGIYSSEWFWAKLLHTLREDPTVAETCFSWVEHCDWIPFLLTGGKDAREIKRGVCAAGHKALWAEEFGGLPPDSFFAGLDPLLAGFTERLFNKTYTADQAAGQISPEWATRLGLPQNTVIGIGAFDAHMGAVGAQMEPYHLVKVMGTSTCDMLVAPMEDMEAKEVKGICGQVNGSIIPGMVGLEAGQSAFGDVYAWFRNLLAWPLDNLLQQVPDLDAGSVARIRQALTDQILPTLSREAAELPLTPDVELGLDWLNGRRTPDANQLLRGGLLSLHLGSDAPRIFRALAEATCFGARKIVDRMIEEGVPVKGLIGVGGVAKKSPFIMQMMADVMNMPIRIHRSEQTCAAGAAMFASVAAGVHASVADAMRAMGQGFDQVYHPDPEKAAQYARRYQRYLGFGEYVEQDTSTVRAASSAVK